MAATIVELFVNLIGNDVSLLAAAKRSSDALEGVSKKSFSLKDTISKMGKASALALTAIGGYSIDAAAKFQTQMELIHTQAGVAQSSIKGLSQAVLDMSSQVGQSPDDLAAGLYHIESAGFRGKQALDILRASAINASMGMSDMETSSQALVGVMAEGFPDIKNAADAAAILNTTVGIGDMKMQQLGSAIATNVLGTFKVAGLQMKDFSAGIATLTDNVTPANVAATRLRMAIALLAGPSNAAEEALKAVGLGSNDVNKAFAHRKELASYGINLSQLSADLRKPNGLLVALQDLQGHLTKSGLTATEQTAVITRAFGGGRTSAGIQTLLSELPRLESKYKALGTSATRAATQQESWAQQQKTYKQQVNDLKASLTTMAIELGNKLLPPLTKFVNYLVQHQTAMKTFFTIVLIGLALMTAAWIGMGAAALAASWEIQVIILVVVAISVAIYELVKHWGTIWGFIKRISLDVWHALVTAWNATWNAIKDAIGWIKKEIIDPIGRFIGMIVKGWNSGWNDVKAAIHWIKTDIFDPIGRFFGAIARGFKSGWNDVKTVLAWVKSDIFMPIGRLIDDFIVKPVKAYLNIVMIFWKFAWGFISQLFINLWTRIKEAWTLIKSVFDWAMNTIFLPVGAWINHHFVDPLIALFRKFLAGVKFTWHEFGIAANVAWDVLKVIWGYIKRDFIDKIVDAWDWMVKQVERGWNNFKSDANAVWKFLKTLWGYVQRDFINKLVDGWNWMASEANKAWGKVKSAANDAWDLLKKIWGYIKRDFIDKITSAWDTLVKDWDKGWSKVKNAVSDAWNKTIKPILDKLEKQFDKIIGLWDKFKSAPGKAGSSLANFLTGGFADGGRVPGAKGAPMLTIVHGGEYVLSNDMQAGRAPMTGLGSVFTGAGATAGVATAGANNGIDHYQVYVDGKALFDWIVQRSQRNKGRTTTTYLT